MIELKKVSKAQKQVVSVALSLIMILGTVISVSAAPAITTNDVVAAGNTNAQSDISGGTILHAWSWSFNTIKKNMANIANAGYSAVQTSPINECYVGDGGGMQLYGKGKWYYHYQPTNYTIGNYQLGTEQEFKEMCETAHSYGVKVIVDAVVNHTTSNTGAINSEIKNLPGGAFHNNGRVDNYNNRKQNTQNDLLGLKDLNTQNTAVQQMVLAYLKRCVELGADGFRYDAAGHIEVPEDPDEYKSNFWPVVLDNGAEFQYGENLNDNYQSLYPKYMNIVTPTYGENIRNAVLSGTLTAKNVSNYRATDIDASSLITWVESHDNYCNDGSWSKLDSSDINLGWAILAARADSTPLFFSRPAGSSTKSQWGNNAIGAAGNDDYKSKTVSALNHFKNEMNGEGEDLSNPISGNNSLLMIERGEKGIVLINGGNTSLSLKGISVDFPDGTYAEQANDDIVTVNNGTLTGKIAARGILVLNVEKKSDAYILGDVNSDGLVNMRDLLLVQKYIAHFVTFTERQIVTADVNLDGNVNMRDLLDIQKHIAGMIQF